MTDWDGAEYRRVNSLQQWLADRALIGLDLDGVQSLLDVGCGDGRVTAAIAAQIPGAKVIGIDPSPRMISVAPASTDVTFEMGDVLGLTYENAFDAVVSFNALHWVHDQFGALTRIAAALKKPGRALLVFVCAGDRPSLEQIAMQTTAASRWQPYFTDYQAPFVHPEVDDWKAIAVECGFIVTGTKVDDLSWDFGSRDAFSSWCTVGFGGWTERLPVESAAEFVTDVVSAYEAATGSAQIFRFRQLRARLQIS